MGLRAPLPRPLLCPATAQGHRILLINLGKDERPGGYYWVALLSR